MNNQTVNHVVRSHSKERQWLVNLGNGNIVDGVKSLVNQTHNQQSGINTGSRRRKNKSRR